VLLPAVYPFSWKHPDESVWLGRVTDWSADEQGTEYPSVKRHSVRRRGRAIPRDSLAGVYRSATAIPAPAKLTWTTSHAVREDLLTPIPARTWRTDIPHDSEFRSYDEVKEARRQMTGCRKRLAARAEGRRLRSRDSLDAGCLWPQDERLATRGLAGGSQTESRGLQLAGGITLCQGWLPVWILESSIQTGRRGRDGASGLGRTALEIPSNPSP